MLRRVFLCAVLQRITWRIFPRDAATVLKSECILFMRFRSFLPLTETSTKSGLCVRNVNYEIVQRDRFECNE
jgi:hypothetical protein